MILQNCHERGKAPDCRGTAFACICIVFFLDQTDWDSWDTLKKAFFVTVPRSKPCPPRDWDSWDTWDSEKIGMNRGKEFVPVVPSSQNEVGTWNINYINAVPAVPVVPTNFE